MYFLICNNSSILYCCLHRL